jgi:hypothetical protein
MSNIRTMYDGLCETVYSNSDERCIVNTDPSLLKIYDHLETVSIFKDYKNEIGYQGEVVLLEHKKSMEYNPFYSELDILVNSTDKSILPIVLKHEWDDKTGSDEMRHYLKNLYEKSVYFENLTTEGSDTYSSDIVKFINKLKTHYKKFKKDKLSPSLIYKKMDDHLLKIKSKEFRRHKSTILVGFFQEFTNLQIIHNSIRSITADIQPPSYYLEYWKVMFIPQQHYTVPSCNQNKLHMNSHYRNHPELVRSYNKLHTRLINYNTPFICNRYIRKELGNVVVNE